MARIRGLELLYSLVKDQLQSKQDCVVAAIHCLLVNENLQCVGIGEEFSDGDTKTELLPKNWNQNQEVYTLRYTSKDGKNKFLIKIVKAGQVIHANIVLNEDIASAMSVNMDKHIADDFSDFSSTYLDLECLSAAFRRDILEKLIEPPKDGAASTSNSAGNNNQPQAQQQPATSPLREPFPVPRPDNPNRHQLPPGYPFPLVNGPVVGGRDMDPLGRGAGGMFVDPFDPDIGPLRRGPPSALMPWGAVPPGARFDPYGPPGPNRGRPNPDHMRRPDDFDDFI